MKNTVVDRKTLAWIKEGVDETLQFMEGALAEFSENTEDTTPIKTCIGALHRIKGAVQMVEIEGAKILAKEMELLACALVDEKVKHKNEAAEVLAAGMYQLTGYLESLYHGQADLPLVLLPILNDCRACQEKELYSEGDFFSPNLSVAPPLKPARNCAVAGNITTVAKKLRPGYLSGLLGIIKKENEAQGYERLVFVLDNLFLASATEKSQALKLALCGEGYIAPAHGDSAHLQHSFGATFKLKQTDTEIRTEEHRENLATLAELLPEIARDFAGPTAPFGRG